MWQTGRVALSFRLAYNYYRMANSSGKGGRKLIMDDPNVRSLFLSALSLSGELAPAAAAAGVARSTVYDHLERDPAFAAECDAVVGKLRQQAHETLKKIAVDGVTEKRYDKDGNLIGEVTKYDVRALLRLIERHDRQWRTGINIEKTVHHRGKVDISHMSADDKVKLRELLLRNRMGEEPSAN